MADLDNDSVKNVEIGIVGSGSMGSGMTMLFAEHGSVVGCFDKSSDPVKKILETAKKTDSVPNERVHGFSSLKKLVQAFPEKREKPRIFVLSLPHGSVVDGIADELLPLLSKGDIVIDGGNEWWEATEARQKKAEEKGVEWVGMGVSGGYQSARRGPSMSPGCNKKETFETLRPLLEKWAAKTKDGEPCVEYIGPGGAGNYVKMLHNGIEHAHLSIISETRALLHHQLGMSNDDIADLFESWYKDGPLRGNFLIGIGYKGLRFKRGDGITDERGIVEGIEDKVTQDVDLSEGTGTWSTREIADRHVAAPAIAASHQLRVISADKGERLGVVKNLQIPQPSKSDVKPDKEFLKMVEKAVYGCILGAFVQGLDIITRASEDQKWNVSLATCMRIWRAGCIIQSDAICEFLLPLFEPFGPSKPLNILQSIPEVAKALRETYDPIKQFYRIAVDTDAVAPAISATLEWLKAVGGERLPTDFEELELDYFGHHNYDIAGKTEFGKPGVTSGHKKGSHHTEFAPA